MNNAEPMKKPRRWNECAHCSKLFLPDRGKESAWYCSEECRMVSKRNRDKEYKKKAYAQKTYAQQSLAEQRKKESEQQKAELHRKNLQAVVNDIDTALRRIGL